MEYIIKNLIQAGGFRPDSDETGLLDALYYKLYGEHLPNNVSRKITIISFINKRRLQSMMDRLTQGLELEKRILVLCDKLDSERNPRGRAMRSNLRNLLVLGIQEFRIDVTARSSAAWLLLDWLEQADWIEEYSLLQIQHALKFLPAGTSTQNINLLEILESPYINRGRSGASLDEQPSVVIPFRQPIAHENYKERLPKKFGWLRFNYSPNGKRSFFENETSSNDKRYYSIALSYRFLGQGLDEQRRMAEGTIRDMLRLYDSEVYVTRVNGWIKESSNDPNEPDYAFWANAGGREYRFGIKLLRDCMIIIPLEYQSSTHQPIVKVLEAVHRAGNRLKTR